MLNKIDKLERSDELLTWLARHPDAIGVSAHTGEGLDTLAEVVRDTVFGPVRALKITLPLADAAAVAYLERRTDVIDRSWEGDTVTLEARLGRGQAEALQAHTRHACIDGKPLQAQLDVIWPPQVQMGDSCRMPPHRVQAPVSGWGTTDS